MTRYQAVVGKLKLVDMDLGIRRQILVILDVVRSTGVSSVTTSNQLLVFSAVLLKA